jgi:hypothetical protein
MGSIPVAGTMKTDYRIILLVTLAVVLTAAFSISLLLFVMSG